MTTLPVLEERFGTHPTGADVHAYLLQNEHGMRVRVLGYGGIVQSLHVPDRDGAPADVVLGFDTLEEYLANPFYFGALIGRNGNRIAGGRFTIDAREYRLTQNDGAHHLHGGGKGLHQALWSVEPFENSDGHGVVLSWVSPAGDDGYPGTLNVRVTYTLSRNNRFAIAYEATTDAPTIVNLTQHSYFNLSGARGSSVLDHDLQIDASLYTPVNDTLIPLGVHATVAGTPFDFQRARTVGDRIHDADEQLRVGGGYDHNWVLNERTTDMASRAARLVHAPSGRSLELFTTEPGLQVYAGGTFTPGLSGKCGMEYPRFGGIALETQHFPDAPNQPGFPSTVLRPGETYTSRTAWQFGVASR
ncbi:MAG TPA: aldose epimerase family protein [Gemmatimonas sp.]|nr:aldose epimerase family protein [Gemmatimonas sp.]